MMVVRPCRPTFAAATDLRERGSLRPSDARYFSPSPVKPATALARRSTPPRFLGASLGVVSGLAEIGHYFSFALGARHGIAGTAVLGSQFVVTSALASFLLFGERLGRIRIAGVIVIAIGVATLSALQA